MAATSGAAAPGQLGSGTFAAAGSDEERWTDFWADVLRRFTDEAGEPPAAAPTAVLEGWEVALLRKLAAHASRDAANRRRTCAPNRGKALSSDLRRHGPFAAFPQGTATLTACERQLRAAVGRLWAEEAAEEALGSALAHERNGDLRSAQAAYDLALGRGPRRPLEARQNFAQLLRVLGPAAGGGLAASEAQLRSAAECPAGAGAAAEERDGPLTRGKRAALGRLALLLCQEGREEDASPLLQRGGWRYRLAPWVLRYAGCEDVPAELVPTTPAGTSSPPLRVFDDAWPQPPLRFLRELFRTGSSFWQEHGYNEVRGSGENGYFSYQHPLTGPPRSLMDLVIRHVHAVALPHFPAIAEATVAEWWAHCRPHACGHQLHFDSDDEGASGARHPICSCVTFVEAPPSVGGPTLVTDQRLTGAGLAAQGWLVHPRPGRLAAYDGSVLHGVVPGRGEGPAASGTSSARRITWMVAFWRALPARPFGPDGLAGSARPMPEPASPLVAGPRTYTWHQRLALPCAEGADAAVSRLAGWCPEQAANAATAFVPVPLVPAARSGVWTKVDGVRDCDGQGAQAQGHMPSYGECFQF